MSLQVPGQQPTILIDSYMSHCFTPRQAERYFHHLLKNNSIPAHVSPHSSGGESYFFVVSAVPRHIPYQFPGQQCWVIDRGVANKGTVVPQTLWVPHTITDRRNHVEEAELQLPIFFESPDGRLGLPLEAAAAGRCHNLINAQGFAPLGMKSTTHVRIVWPGYVDFKRQVQIRDETSERNPITMFRFAYHIGRSVDAFLKNCQIDVGNPDRRWRIGEGGIRPSDIIIIGAAHVSSGSWMPILQLNRYVL